MREGIAAIAEALKSTSIVDIVEGTDALIERQNEIYDLADEPAKGSTPEDPKFKNKAWANLLLTEEGRSIVDTVVRTVIQVEEMDDQTLISTIDNLPVRKVNDDNEFYMGKGLKFQVLIDSPRTYTQSPYMRGINRQHAELGAKNAFNHFKRIALSEDKSEPAAEDFAQDSLKRHLLRAMVVQEVKPIIENQSSKSGKDGVIFHRDIANASSLAFAAYKPEAVRRAAAPRN